MNPGVRTAIVALVTAAWASSFVASMVSHTYKPDPTVNAAFTLVIGYVLYRAKPNDNGGDQ